MTQDTIFVLSIIAAGILLWLNIRQGRRTDEARMIQAISDLQPDCYAVPLARHLWWSLGKVYVVACRLEKRGMVRSRMGGWTAGRGWRRKMYFEIGSPVE